MLMRPSADDPEIGSAALTDIGRMSVLVIVEFSVPWYAASPTYGPDVFVFIARTMVNRESVDVSEIVGVPSPVARLLDASIAAT